MRVSSARLSTRLFQMPSEAQRSSMGTSSRSFSRSKTRVAPRDIRAGALSLLAAATHFLPPSTTWQTVPSFLRQ